MKVRTPNRFLYFLVYIIMYPVLKTLYRLKVDRKEFDIPKGKPYIVLSNHVTMLDFLVSMLALYPRRLNAVAAQKFFYYFPLNILLPLAGCIPKNMFDPDVRSIIGIKKALKQGGGIMLFPEGRCSHSQAYAGIHISTGKLLKNLGVPVVSCYIEGLVNCLALWRRGTRFGHMRVTYKKLFSEDDLERMSVDEINNAIDLRLSGREGVVPPEKPLQTVFSRQLAEGLEYLLYYCPGCGSEFTTQTKKNTIYCEKCGYKAILSRAGKFIFEDNIPEDKRPDGIPEWYGMQMQYETGRLSEDMQTIEERVMLQVPSQKSGGGMAGAGSGILRINPEGWRYEGEHNGQPVSLFFPVDTVPAITDDTFNNIQLFHEGKFYVFVPDDFRKCIKYIIIAECLHRRFAKTPLLTKGAV